MKQVLNKQVKTKKVRIVKRRTEMRQKTRTKAEWEELIKECRSSGKSMREWCAEKGINYKTMCGNTYLVPSRTVNRSDYEWIELMKRQQSSGMSQAGWCRDNKINSSAMTSATERIKLKLGIGFSSVLTSEKTYEQALAEASAMNRKEAECKKTGTENIISELQSKEGGGRRESKESQTSGVFSTYAAEESELPNENESKWVSVFLPSKESGGIQSPYPKDVSLEVIETVNEENKGKNTQHPQITIKCGKLTIETYAGCPPEHLVNLIGKLAEAC